MKKVDISIQNISKVEGHADLDVKVRDGKVHAVHIKFTDNKRFFTQAIRRQNIRVIPQSVARICGTCSIAHTMCPWQESAERAASPTPCAPSRRLRRRWMWKLPNRPP
ncbi:hypothetical protein J4453_02550 [Candidatus Woesearchaeota archaeon]|nr:hypothetical protein [Candidatus Woesearchaeota archaeon]